MLGCRHAKSAPWAHLPLTPERSAECCGGEATTGLTPLPRPIHRNAESFRSPQAAFREGFPQDRRRPQRPRPIGAHSEGMHPEHPPQTRQSQAQRTIPSLPRLLPHRLTALATTLVVCGSFAALPDTQPAQDMSTVTSAAMIPVPPAPELQDPAFPEPMGTPPVLAGAAHSLTSSTSLFTSSGLIARFAEET